MANEADFVVRLIDRITAPARRVSASLGNIDKAAKSATNRVRQLNASLSKLSFKSIAKGIGRAASGAFMGLGNEMIGLSFDDVIAGALEKSSRGKMLGGISRGFLRIGAMASNAAGRISTVGTAIKRTGILYNVLRGRASKWHAVGIAGTLAMRHAFIATAGGALALAQRLASIVRSGVSSALNMAARGALNLASSLASAVFAATKLGIAIGAIVLAVGALGMTKATVEMGMFSERITSAFSLLEGSAERGNNAFQHAVALSRDLGLGIKSTAEQMLALRQASFSVGESKELVSLMADMQAVGATAEQTGRAIFAITQVKAKRKLMAEELQGQLAETGIDVGMVKEKIGQITGKDLKGVDKMMQAGEVTADIGLEAIALAIKAKTKVENAGDAARKISTSTLGGLWATLKDMPDRFFNDVASRLKDKDGLLDTVRTVIAAIETIDRDMVADFVGNMIKGLSNAAVISMEFFKGFFGQLDKIAAEMGFASSAEDSLKSAKEAGETFATVVVDGIRAIKVGLGVVEKMMERFESYGGVRQLRADIIGAYKWFVGVWTTADSIAQTLGGWKNVLIGVMVLKFLTPFFTLAATIAFAVWKVKQLAKLLQQISLMRFPGLEAAIAGGGLRGALAQRVKGGQKVAGKAGELLGKAPGQAGKMALGGAKSAIGKAFMAIPGMAAIGRMMSGAGGLVGKAGGALAKIPGVGKIGGKLAGMGAAKVAGGVLGRAAGLVVPGLNVAMAAYTAYELAEAFGLTDMAKQAWQAQFGGTVGPNTGAMTQAGKNPGKNVNMKVDMPITVNGGSSGDPAQDRRLAEIIGAEVNKRWLTFADEQLSEAVP